MSNFVYTTAISKLRRLTKRTRVVPGGTSAGKTFGILPILADKAARTPGLQISVVSESVPHLRRGAMKDFLTIMKATHRYIDDHWNRSLLTYYFANGSYIEFFSADSPDKLRGPRRNILYLNEANNLPWDSYYQLAIRTSDEVWIDFNPTNEFWAHTELANDLDSDWLTLTYLDNEGLPKSLVKELEKAYLKAFYKWTHDTPREDLIKPGNIKSNYWYNWVKCYLWGQVASLEGVVFSNWKTIDTLPSDARLVGYGLDWGYSNDPTAIVAVYSWNGKRILEERCYQKGLLNKQIADMIPSGVTVYCDSAEPKSIAELNSYGKRALPTRKGPDSIVHGIQVMQQQEYLVTAGSTNLIKELRNYIWDTDKTGKRLNKPVDAWNHGIDSVRYHEVMTVGLPQKKGFVITI